MARTGSLGGTGSLSPFGSGDVSFGAFDVANTKSTSAQETASLAWAVARAQYDAGQITDSQYQAAQAAYYAALDPATQGYATGQYQIAQTQYSIDRDNIAQAVQAGQLPPSALVDFDRNALAQVVPGSAEYRQRQDRLWSSQGMVFQADEAKVQDDLSHGYITNTQAQDWYKAQSELYADNYSVAQDISSKIGQLQDRIYGEADQAMADAWNNGHLTIGQVVAYVSKVQAADPQSQRARDLKTFADQAKDQQVGKSLSMRYDLSREYAQLAAFVASSGSTTQYSTSHSTRTYLGADGKWHTVTTETTKAVKPSASEVAANAKRQLEVAQAKQRMAAIQAEVGMMPGGWVTADDVIAQLKQQQAAVKVGTPQWYAIQKDIDAVQQQKASDQLLAQQGVKITFPKVGSELIKDLSVGSAEKVRGWTSAQIAQGKAYVDKITAYQAELDSGNATDERAVVLQAAINKNLGYLNTLAGKVGSAPPSTLAPTRTGTSTGGGTGGTRSSGGSAASTTRAPTATAPGAAPAPGAGPFQVVQGTVLYQQTKGAIVNAPYNAAYVKTTPAGYPANMSPTAFDDLYDHAVAAIKAGKATFAYGGVSYAIPTNPNDRLKFLDAIDTQNLALKAEQYNATVGKPGVSQSAVDTKARAYSTAVANAQTNKMYVLDSSSPGALKDSSGKTIKITEYVVNPVNTLGWARDIQDVAIAYAKDQYAAAAEYMKVGDYTSAAKCIALGNQKMEATIPVVAKYAAQAQNTVDQAVAQGGKPPEAVTSDLKRLSDPGAEWAAVAAPGKKIADELFGADGKGGILKVNDGVPILVRTPDGKGWEAVLNDGVVRTVSPDGKITATKGNVVDAVNWTTGGKNNQVKVQVKTASGFVDALATYDLGPVGTISVGGQTVTMTGKIITVNGETWGENPLQPGQWVPVTRGNPIRIAVGGNVKPFQIQAGSGMGVPTGTVGLEWTTNGTGYMLLPDAATGTYNLYRTALDGSPQLIGPAATANGTVDAIVTGVLNGAGIRLDVGSMTTDQRSYLNLLKTGNPVGAWFGTTPGEVSTFLNPKPGNPAIPSPKLPGDTYSEKALIGMGGGTVGWTNPYESSYNQPVTRTGPSAPLGGALVGGVQYGGSPTYTPAPVYGEGSAVTAKPLTAANYTAASYQQPTGYAYKPTTYGEGSAVTAKPLTVTKPPTTTPTYGEGSAITAKPLPTTTTKPTSVTGTSGAKKAGGTTPKPTTTYVPKKPPNVGALEY